MKYNHENANIIDENVKKQSKPFVFINDLIENNDEKVGYLKFNAFKKYAKYINKPLKVEAYMAMTSVEIESTRKIFKDLNFANLYLKFNIFALDLSEMNYNLEFSYFIKVIIVFCSLIDKEQYIDNDQFKDYLADISKEDDIYTDLKNHIMFYLKGFLDFYTLLNYLYAFINYCLSLFEKIDYKDKETYHKLKDNLTRYGDYEWLPMKVYLIYNNISIGEQVLFLATAYCYISPSDDLQVYAKALLLAYFSYEPYCRFIPYTPKVFIDNTFDWNDITKSKEKSFVQLKKFILTNRSEEMRDYFKEYPDLDFDMNLGAYINYFEANNESININFLINHFTNYYEVYKFEEDLSRDDNKFMKSVEDGSFTKENLEQYLVCYQKGDILLHDLAHFTKLYCYVHLKIMFKNQSNRA